MARPRFQAPKGTRDLLPPDTALWAAVEATAREVFSRYGYQEIRTPIFEDTDLFVRGVGESSDIVGKEMYTFPDKAGRSLTLRPESTAAVCRAYVEHGMQSGPQPVRLYYIGPQFRYERPQKGRFRQFHQIGAELIGGRGSMPEFEILAMLDAFFAELGFEDRMVLLNTVGDAESRAGFRQKLVEYLSPFAEQLSEDSRRRLVTNPLRILDSKSRDEQELLARGPKLGDCLTEGSRGNYEEVKSALSELGIRFKESPHLVRGLDYYTETVFEIVSLDERLGTQNALCGGGSYDGLIEELGGPPTNGVGFAIGEDRLIDVLPQAFKHRVARETVPPIGVLCPVESAGPLHHSSKAELRAFEFAERLRRAGRPVHFLRGRVLAKLEDQARKLHLTHYVLHGPTQSERGTVAFARWEGVGDRWKWVREPREVADRDALAELSTQVSARTPDP